MAKIQLGDKAPDFTINSTMGTINLYDYLGKSWGILLSHPSDFTPICTSELGALSQLKIEFDKRNVKILALSIDDVASHNEWIKDINEVLETNVNFPILADENKEVSYLYDMIHPNVANNFTVRSVFVIAPDKTVKLTLTYPLSMGRNFHELLRTIDSLRLTAYYNVGTPANWKHGEDVVISKEMSTEEAQKKFTKGIKEIKPYLRTTSDPLFISI